MTHIEIGPNQVRKCPKCGNDTSFIAHSQQVSEDHCEVWVTCICGYDAGAESRYENVMGGTSEPNVRIALYCWNDAVIT